MLEAQYNAGWCKEQLSAELIGPPHRPLVSSSGNHGGYNDNDIATHIPGYAGANRAQRAAGKLRHIVVRAAFGQLV